MSENENIILEEKYILAVKSQEKNELNYSSKGRIIRQDRC